MAFLGPLRKKVLVTGASNSGKVANRVMLKDRLLALTEKIPLLGHAADPFMATVLAGFVVLTVVAVAITAQIFPGDDGARSHVLQLAGGLLVVGAFYFTAVGWRWTRADHHGDLLLSTLEKLESASEAVRVGAIKLLASMAGENPNLPKDAPSRAAALAQRDAILAALTVTGEDAAGRTAVAAREACSTIRGQ